MKKHKLMRRLCGYLGMSSGEAQMVVDDPELRASAEEYVRALEEARELGGELEEALGRL